MAEPLMQTHLPLAHRRQGKVRDLYDAVLADGTQAVVLVATDRISAFDVVMSNGIPGKGIILTQISRFWFNMIQNRLGHRLGHHVISTDPAVLPGLSDSQRALLRGRVMIGRKTQVIPIECVVRGYLAGSGWSEYRKTQSVCGEKLPPGLRQCEKLPSPIFTPATKQAAGHDENISFERACQLVGRERMTTLREWSIAIYQMAHDYAAARGILLADTKFEFGLPLDPNPTMPILVDEALTPDSSRFWPASEYAVGRDQNSFDKQYVRNYLQSLVDAGRWNKQAPGPMLPREVVKGTLDRYLEAYRILTGQNLQLDSDVSVT